MTYRVYAMRNQKFYLDVEADTEEEVYEKANYWADKAESEDKYGRYRIDN